VKVDAVVLAGGDGAVIDPAIRFKGLVPIAGKPMVAWVVEALRAAETVAEIAVVVPTAEALGNWVDSVDKIVVSDAGFADNAIAGVGAFRNDRHVLVCTGDIPALTPEAVDDFVSQAQARGADFAYPLVRKEHMLEQYPGSVRSFVKLADGPITGGNMLMVSPMDIERHRQLGERLFITRKSAVKMARVIGFRFALKLASGHAHVPDLEAKLEELLGGTAAAIYTTHASIGADVDKPVDVVVAERVLYAREGQARAVPAQR